MSDAAQIDGARGGKAARTLGLVAGGAIGAALLTLLQLPAGTLIGAMLGAATVRRYGERWRPGASWVIPRWLRNVGLVLLGCVAGLTLDADTIRTLWRVAVPLLLTVAALLVVDVAAAAVLVRRYAIDPVTAVIACAPGGVSELAVTAQERGARLEIVLAIHMVRVAAVMFVVLPVLVLVLRPS